MGNVIKTCRKCKNEKEHTIKGKHCVDCKKAYDKNRVERLYETLRSKGLEYRSKEETKRKKQEYDKIYREENREQKLSNRIIRKIQKKDYIDCRKSILKNKYNMTLEDYDRMVIEQNHVCAICKLPNKTTATNKLFVDHCHTTGNIRGLLCSRCNSGIGSLKDNTETLLSAIQYLEKHKPYTGPLFKVPTKC